MGRASAGPALLHFARRDPLRGRRGAMIAAARLPTVSNGAWATTAIDGIEQQRSAEVVAGGAALPAARGRQLHDWSMPARASSAHLPALCDRAISKVKSSMVSFVSGRRLSVTAG